MLPLLEGMGKLTLQNTAFLTREEYLSRLFGAVTLRVVGGLFVNSIPPPAHVHSTYVITNLRPCSPCIMCLRAFFLCLGISCFNQHMLVCFSSLLPRTGPL